MLDIRKIKENPEGVKAALKAKEVDCDATIDRILELDEQHTDTTENASPKRDNRRGKLV